MTVNREYKTSVFTALFSDDEKLLNLYNAITNNNLPPDTPIEIATLEGILFNERRNDIAFIVGSIIVSCNCSGAMHLCSYHPGKRGAVAKLL